MNFPILMDVLKFFAVVRGRGCGFLFLIDLSAVYWFGKGFENGNQWFIELNLIG